MPWKQLLLHWYRFRSLFELYEHLSSRLWQEMMQKSVIFSGSLLFFCDILPFKKPECCYFLCFIAFCSCYDFFLSALDKIVHSGASEARNLYMYDSDSTFVVIAWQFSCTSYYTKVVFVNPSPGICYTAGDAVDWCVAPTAWRFIGGSNHSPLVGSLIS